MKFPPDLDSGPLAFLTVSNEEVWGGEQGNNPTLTHQSLLDPKIAGDRETGSLNKVDIKDVYLADLYLIEYLEIQKMKQGDSG